MTDVNASACFIELTLQLHTARRLSTLLMFPQSAICWASVFLFFSSLVLAVISYFLRLMYKCVLLLTAPILNGASDYSGTTAAGVPRGSCWWRHFLSRSSFSSNSERHRWQNRPAQMRRNSRGRPNIRANFTTAFQIFVFQTVISSL